MKRTSRRILVPVATLLAAPLTAQNWFDTPRAFLDGPFDRLACAGDIDGDGDADLVGFGMDADLVYPMLNSGAGDFNVLPGVALNSGTHEGFAPARMGDLNGNGRQDFVLLNNNPEELQILYGRTDGNFTPVLTIALPAPAEHFALGDFNSDGRADIALSFGSQVAWLFETASGFQYSPFLDLGLEISGLSAADLNADGSDDLAVGYVSQQQVSVVLTANGVPTLDSTYAVAGEPAASPVPYAGDIDGDGDVDILALCDGLDNGLHLTALENTGAALLAPQASQLLPNLAWALAEETAHLGDWDGDGDLDLAGSAKESSPLEYAPTFSNLVRNIGGLTFERAFEYETYRSHTPAGFADFDGNGDLDFASSITILFGNGKFQYPFALDGVAGAKAHDADGDGDFDLLNFAADWRYSNDGSGAFTLETFTQPPTTAPDAHWRESRIFTDLDGDGLADLLRASEVDQGWFANPDFLGTHLLRDDGSFNYIDAGLAGPATADLESIEWYPNLWADLDSDGDTDLLPTRGTVFLPTVEIWSNDGSGYFAAPDATLTGAAYGHGDVDGDGDIDLLTHLAQGISGPNTFQLVHLQRNLGNLNFATTAISPTLGNRPAWIDVDLDGDLDVIMRTYTTGSLSVVLLANDGTGAFGPEITLIAESESYITEYSVVDIDADGLADLVANEAVGPAPTTTHFATVLRRDSSAGALAYEAPRTWLLDDPVTFADIDNDGDLDGIAAQLTRGRTYEGPADGTVRQYGQGSIGTGGAIPVLGAQGPFRADSTTIELRLRRAPGGTLGALLYGTQEAQLPNFGVPSLTGYVQDLFPPLPFTTTGAPASPGTGEWTLVVPSPGPALIGQPFFHQAFLLDPAAPFGFTATSGLKIRYGN